MAPEVLFGAYSQKADIYSYAILLWELFHVQVPYKNISGRRVIALVQQMVRPQMMLPPACMPLISLTTECWSQDSAQRPEMHLVLSRLRDLRIGDENVLIHAPGLITPATIDSAFRPASGALTASERDCSQCRGNSNTYSNNTDTAKLSNGRLWLEQEEPLPVPSVGVPAVWCGGL